MNVNQDEFLLGVPHDRPIVNIYHRHRDILDVVLKASAEFTSDQLTESLPQVFVESIMVAIVHSVPARVPRPTGQEVALRHLMRSARPSIHPDAIHSLPRGLLAGLPRFEPPMCCRLARKYRTHRCRQGDRRPLDRAWQWSPLHRQGLQGGRLLDHHG